MELLILDETFSGIDTLDIFESLIWTDRYSEYGEFEIYTPASTAMLDKLQPRRYLYTTESEHVMIIEDRELETDVENGTHLKVTGRSLESILDRRIVWEQTNIDGSLQDGIKKLLDENVISPSDGARQISNFVFEASDDPTITDLTFSAQYTGDNLYEVIYSICESFGLGFKILLTDDGNFVFKLYNGADRSYDQTTNPYVVFSPGFDNILNSNYIESEKSLKTVTLVAGEGEGTDRKTTTVDCFNGAGSGLERREMYTDARDLSMTTQEGITEAQYLEQLKQRGLEDLSENTETKSFEGQADANRTYKYGVDYFIGDIMQVVNEYGIESTSRVTEFVISQSTSGVETYPTFTIVPQLQNKLPSGYTQVSYIEAHWGEYIDTWFSPNSNTRVVMDVQLTQANSSTNYSAMFAAKTYGTSGLSGTFCLYGISGDNQFRFDYNTSESLFYQLGSNIIGTRYLLDANKNTLTVTNVATGGTGSVSYTAAYFKVGATLYLLSKHIPEGSIEVQDKYAYARVYSCKIYSGNSLVRNYVPAVDETGEAGLYDLVTAKFFKNIGTGAFTYG